MTKRLKKYSTYILSLLLVIICCIFLFVNNKIKVSVIVPVYNTEKYLEQCLSSLEKHNSKNIEFILIDDGSTDNSLKIMYNFAKRDNRFRVYTQKNMGVGYTRNRGIDLAKGEYIGFVDSDDFVSPDYFIKLYNKAEEYGADMAVVSNVMRVIDNRKEIMILPIWKYTKEGYLNNYTFMVGKGAQIWDKIYKKSFLKGNKIEHYKRKIWFEDEWFSTLVSVHAKKVVIVDNAMYYYRYRQDGLSSMYGLGNNTFENGLQFYCDLIKEVINVSDDKILKDKLIDKVKWYIKTYKTYYDENSYKKFMSVCNI